jgi:hypothetical protein
MAAMFHLGAKWDHVSDEHNNVIALCLPVAVDR